MVSESKALCVYEFHRFSRFIFQSQDLLTLSSLFLEGACLFGWLVEIEYVGICLVLIRSGHYDFGMLGIVGLEDEK